MEDRPHIALDPFKWAIPNSIFNTYMSTRLSISCGFSTTPFITV